MTSADATVKLIRTHYLHRLHHVLADMTTDACAFCRIEEAISMLPDQPQRDVMWHHYLKFTKALQR